MRVIDAAEQFGITYRQLDYWLRCRWVHAPQYGSGRGHEREIPDSELQVIDLMARLIRAGFLPARAAELARLATTTRSVTVRLDGDLTIILEPRT